jgi:ferredoxin--NADP+ reductase
MAQTKHLRGTIVSRRDFTEDLWSVRIEPEAAFSFIPGQYATLGVARDGRVLERPYSIVSSPAESALEFFLERVPEGRLTPLLYDLGPGAGVLLRPRPKGVFTMAAGGGRRNHLLVCTVTGVAPFVSMVRTLAREASGGGTTAPPRVVLIEGASRSREMGYREELDGAARTQAWLHHIATVSRPWEDPAWKGERGRIEDVLRKHIDPLALRPDDTTVYLCGHPGMIASVRAIMLRAGFPGAHIREEQYWAAAMDGGSAA